MTRSLWCVVALTSLWLVGCTSTKKDDSYPPEPTLELLSAAPTSIKAFEDTLKFTLQYRDGDGDLGSDNPDQPDLFVFDSRLDSTFRQGFHIRKLAPVDSDIRITGKLIVPLTHIPLTGSAAEKAAFSLYIVDRAGNRSNTVTTGEIMITP